MSKMLIVWWVGERYELQRIARLPHKAGNTSGCKNIEWSQAGKNTVTFVHLASLRRPYVQNNAVHEGAAAEEALESIFLKDNRVF